VLVDADEALLIERDAEPLHHLRLPLVGMGEEHLARHPRPVFQLHGLEVRSMRPVPGAGDEAEDLPLLDTDVGAIQPLALLGGHVQEALGEDMPFHRFSVPVPLGHTIDLGERVVE